jgi:hypothetical protein
VCAEHEHVRVRGLDLPDDFFVHASRFLPHRCRISRASPCRSRNQPRAGRTEGSVCNRTATSSVTDGIRRALFEGMLVDEFLPVYDVSDSVATVVQADLATTWGALMDVDLIEVGRRRPLVAVLGSLRAVPEIVSHVLHGEPPVRAPKQLRLRDTTHIPLGKGGWVLLGERPREEIALGLIGKFWRPVIPFAKVTAEEFASFSEPGFGKTVYSLSVRALDERRTLLTGVMRTATTNEDARRWFRRYWTFGVGAGAHVLVNAVIDLVREMAEHSAGER